ncbi:MAG: hypothetical protein V4535_02595 [Bacteroidota bacterium]
MKNAVYAIVLFSFMNLSAQIHFEKGYFISNNLERTECFIRNIDWLNNPTNFEYKLTADSKKSQTGDMESILEFGVYDESKYKRFTVNIEKSGDDLRYVTTNKNPVWVKETLFLKVLVEGEASLYQYVQDNFFKYFYKTETVPLNQLISIKYISNELVSDNINSYSDGLKTNNYFRQQLYNDVKCDDMSLSNFQNIGYNRGDLIQHFTKFNSCQGKTKSTYAVQKEKGKLNFKVAVGMNMVSLSITDGSQHFNRAIDIKKSVVGFGAEVEYVLPFNKQKWSLILTPTYQNFTTDKTYVKNDGFGGTGTEVTNHVDINYSYFEVPLGMRHYIFLNPKSRLFINVSYAIYIDKGDLKFTQTGSVDEEYDLKSKGGSIDFGVGYSYNNRINLEVKTDFKRGISTSSNYGVDYSSVGLQLSYRIF